MPGPGAILFEELQASLGELPIVAENLGVITPEVEAIRERFGYPGMSILQFRLVAIRRPEFSTSQLFPKPCRLHRNP